MQDSTVRFDVPALETTFACFWRRVHDMSAELKRGADSRWVQVKLEQALDTSLVDYTHWQAAKAKRRPRDP
jgi:hypothetical protein